MSKQDIFISLNNIQEEISKLLNEQYELVFREKTIDHEIKNAEDNLEKFCYKESKKVGFTHVCRFDVHRSRCYSRTCQSNSNRFHPYSQTNTSQLRNYKKIKPQLDHYKAEKEDLYKDKQELPNKIKNKEKEILEKCCSFFDILLKLITLEDSTLLRDVLVELAKIEHRLSNPINGDCCKFLFKTWDGIGISFDNKILQNTFVGTYDKPGCIIYLALIYNYYSKKFLEHDTLKSLFQRLDDSLKIAQVDVTNIYFSKFGRDVKYDFGYLINPYEKRLIILPDKKEALEIPAGKTVPFELFKKVFPETFSKFITMSKSTTTTISEGMKLGYLSNATIQPILVNYYNACSSAKGKTKRRKRRKEPKKKKLETKKKIDFKKLRKHITQRLKPRFKFRRSKTRSKARNKK